MEYKIITVFGNTFYAKNKKELFKFFDSIGGYWSINSKCGRAFNISKERGSVLLGYEDNYRFEYLRKIPVYIDYEFIVYDKHRFVVDYKTLKDEYKASRKVKFPTPRRWRVGKFGFKKDRKPFYNAKFKEAKSSCKKEYTDLIAAKEEGVHVRTKRFDELRIKHVFFYDDDLYRRDGVKSWKDKKVKKQWMKNKKRT